MGWTMQVENEIVDDADARRPDAAVWCWARFKQPFLLGRGLRGLGQRDR